MAFGRLRRAPELGPPKPTWKVRNQRLPAVIYWYYPLGKPHLKRFFPLKPAAGTICLGHERMVESVN